MWPANRFFGKRSPVLTERERIEMARFEVRDVVLGLIVYLPILIIALPILKSVFGYSASRSPGTSDFWLFAGIGVYVLVLGWRWFELHRLKSIHRQAFVEGTKTGLRVCTNCEYPLPAEPLEGVCSECGCPYNPETLLRVWTERHGKLADVQPSTR